MGILTVPALTLFPAPAEAVVDELRILGVDAISTGKKNQSTQSLLQWVSDKPSKSPRPAIAQKVQEIPLPFQEEFSPAGRPTHANREKDGFTPSKNKIVEYYSLTKPYGVDEESPKTPQLKSSFSSPTVKSLSDIMKSGNKQRSLSEYLNK